LARFEFKSRTGSGCFILTFISFGESRLLVLWCACGRCGMACSDEDRGRSRRPAAEDWGWSHRSGTQWLSDREVGWHCERSAPCTWRRGARVSWLSLKTMVDGLSVVWPQNHWNGFSSVWTSKLMATIYEWLGLKTTRAVFPDLASKSVATVLFGLTSKPVVTISRGLALKAAAMVSAVWPQNLLRRFLSVWPQKWW
jgi:hypothetical protein